MEAELPEEEFVASLRDLPGWEARGWRKAERIAKVFGVPDLNTALQFVNAVAGAVDGAERRIQVYFDHKVVEIALGANGAIIQNDVAFASRIDQIATRFAAVVPRIPRWPKTWEGGARTDRPRTPTSGDLPDGQ